MDWNKFGQFGTFEPSRSAQNTIIKLIIHKVSRGAIHPHVLRLVCTISSAPLLYFYNNTRMCKNAVKWTFCLFIFSYLYRRVVSIT